MFIHIGVLMYFTFEVDQSGSMLSCSSADFLIRVIQIAKSINQGQRGKEEVTMKRGQQVKEILIDTRYSHSCSVSNIAGGSLLLNQS